MFLKKYRLKLISILLLPVFTLIIATFITQIVEKDEIQITEVLKYERSYTSVPADINIESIKYESNKESLTSDHGMDIIDVEQLKTVKKASLKNEHEQVKQPTKTMSKNQSVKHSIEGLDENQIRQNYKAVEVIATGYYAGVESTGKTPEHPEYGITYSGVKVQRAPDSISTIAADLNLFPLGTVLYIPGYGYGIVADIGSAIKGNVIDLYFNSKEDVYNLWGKKKLDVFIIEEGNGQITEAILRQKMEFFRS
ncbi:3D domain-containing protein [Chengkuizengella axinellae]|uniref:3D domain-containing protein n=1 Tax=Chengkuizengella axinellae TaxID=3064388 RepID=A0ABT9J0M8_9BACL|nr:3D domain-containing protein [Chengkuizengella sp. 2205SS18-9]MDP5275179.1 3D domain-containing protein [Chengkuizengella sp. 2205SS18-9]